jgi:nitrate/nitrite-specific signal transduction histidine kinase
MKKLSLSIKLRLLFVLPVYLAIFLAANLAYTYSILEERDSKNQWAEKTEQLSAQLYLIGHDVAYYHNEERPQQQWLYVVDKLEQQLETLPGETVEERRLLNKLSYRLNKIHKLFYEFSKINPEEMNAESRRGRVMKQLLIHAQEFMFTVLQSRHENEIYFKKIRDRIILVMVAGSLVYLLISAQLAYLMNRGVLRPISELKKWSADFISGNLDRKIEIESHNEFMELASGLSEMGGQIKSNYLEMIEAISERENFAVQTALLQQQLDQCQSFNLSGSICWDLHRDDFVLSDNTMIILFPGDHKKSISLAEFLSKVYEPDRDRVAQTLKRSRDERTGFGLECRILRENISAVSVLMIGDLFAGQSRYSDQQYILITLKVQ